MGVFPRKIIKTQGKVECNFFDDFGNPTVVSKCPKFNVKISFNGRMSKKPKIDRWACPFFNDLKMFYSGQAELQLFLGFPWISLDFLGLYWISLD